MEIEQRLGLYQVFLKLYQHHRSLLDEILQLEKTSNKTFYRVATRSVTGVVQEQQGYLITNLVGEKTQTLLQPQGIWTIGRDRQMAISIPDQRLSRRHAVIQYIHNQGFYLVDLDSTNGTFVNGEPVHGRLLLKDGDRIRLSSLAFSFFVCQDSLTLDEIPADLSVQLQSSTTTPILATVQQSTLPRSSVDIKTATAEPKEETSNFLKQPPELEELIAESGLSQLSPAQQSEILDRFFSRQIHKASKPN